MHHACHAARCPPDTHTHTLPDTGHAPGHAAGRTRLTAQHAPHQARVQQRLCRARRPTGTRHNARQAHGLHAKTCARKHAACQTCPHGANGSQHASRTVCRVNRLTRASRHIHGTSYATGHIIVPARHTSLHTQPTTTFAGQQRQSQPHGITPPKHIQSFTGHATGHVPGHILRNTRSTAQRGSQTSRRGSTHASQARGHAIETDPCQTPSLSHTCQSFRNLSV